MPPSTIRSRPRSSPTGAGRRNDQGGHHGDAGQCGDRLPHGCHAGDRPGRHGDLHHSRPRGHHLQRDSGHQYRHRHPGDQHGCADGQPTCQADVSFANPAQLEVAKTHSPTNPVPVPGQRFTYTVTVTNPGNSATGSGTFSDPLPDPPLDAAGATWTCTAAGDRVNVRASRRVPDRPEPTGVPITVAPNGGTVTFTITVTIRTSAVPVTVDNVGSVTPGTRHRVRGRAADLRRRGHLHGHPRDGPAHHHQVPHPGRPDAAGGG